MTEIELSRVDGEFHLVAKNQDGNEVHLDASPSIGGTGKGMRPMQMLLSALAGCSTIDVLSILRKQQQEVTGIKVYVKGDRKEGKAPNPFQSIQLRYVVFGNVTLEKAERAVSLSIDKYCSVAATLDKSVKLTYSCEVEN
ncbi:MAG: OsmC family protein [Cyclobacteriaceae bacterium]